MTKLNKSIISPAIKHNQGFVFHASGQNFKMTGNVIETFNESNDGFNALVNATNLFTINENGIEFFYDFDSKSKVTSLDESTLNNFDTMLGLNEKIEFLNESKKSLKSAIAITEIKKEIALLESNLTQIKKKPMGVHFKYVANENKYFMNYSELLGGTAGSITEHAFATGLIKYEDKSLLETFELAAFNFESYKILDFISESIDGDVKVLAMRADNNIYVCRINESTKLVKFQRMLADEAIDYVVEETGSDITFMVEDILESFKERKAERNAKVQTMHEMIAFLKDQKGRLDEADRNIPEIKQADVLLNSEITRIQEEISALEAESLLGRTDGYVTGVIKGDLEGIQKGAEIKVDAVEYTGAGKQDLLTVFLNDEPVRVEKFLIELPVGEIA
ncbi:hypothetical protein OAC86_00540 [bacterium]|nr:hypothetical protein [bacterium]